MHVGRGRLRHALTIALDALAVVVELGRLAQQQIVVLVALPLELVGVGVAADRAAVGRVGGGRSLRLSSWFVAVVR